MKEAKNPKTPTKVSISDEQLRELIIKRLPKLIKKEPVLRDYLASLFKEKFADKEKTDRRIKALIEEIRNLRIESEKRWEENQKRLDEHSKILKQHSETIEFLLNEVKSLKTKFDIGIGALGARWGIKSEASFRNALKGILEENFPVRVEKYVATDVTGEVFDGIPNQSVELDIIVKDGKLIIAEIKSSVSKADVWLFEKKVRFYENKEGKKPDKKIIISPMIEPKAESLIQELGIKAYTSVPESEEEL